MNEIKIDKNVPIPEKKGTSIRNGMSNFLRSMEIGDSFVALRSERYNISGVATRIGIKVTCRLIDANNIRVWRLK